MSIALAISGLHKTYSGGLPGCSARVEALRGVELDVHEGELLGLLGPNGAGKSTLLLCAAGLLRPDAGRVVWFGSAAVPFGRPPGIAYVPERSVYHRFLSVREVLEFHATLHEMSAIDRGRAVSDVIERVGFHPHAAKRVAQLSRGMIQRLGIAQALIGRPRLVLLDETISGLDPVAAREVRTLLQAMAADGTTIVLSSHDLPSLEHLCTRVVVMMDGRVHASVDPKSLTGTRALVLDVDSPQLAARLLRTRRCDNSIDGAQLRVPLAGCSPEDVLADCVALGIDVRGSRVVRDDLAQHFFDLIERPARVAEGRA